MLKEFRQFAMRGNVIDLAVGVIIGTAVGKIVTSLVNDIIMPPIGLILGNVDFGNLFVALDRGSYASLVDAQTAGAPTLSYGVFINTLIDFILVAFVVFLLVRSINRLHSTKPPEPDQKDCPFCFSSIPIRATRCPQCTSQL